MEQSKYTFCRICEPGCGLKASVVDGKLKKITGNKNHLVTKGYICARGLASLDIHHDPDRIKYPVKQVNGNFEHVEWKTALKDIGQRLKNIREKYGNDSVAVYFGNPIAFDFGFSLYMPMAINTLKTRNIYSAGSQDCNNKFVASEKIFGSPLLHPIPDIDNTDFLIIWGSNPAISKMSFISLARPEERLRAIEKRGGRVIIIDPRKTETAMLLGEHVYIRPDTDIYLMMSMLNTIISKNLHDTGIVSRHTRGFDELKNIVAKYPAKTPKYMLSDEYLRFYFKYIKPNLHTIKESTSKRIFETISGNSFDKWLGFRFENFCIKHAGLISRIMGFEDEVLIASPYFEKTSKNFQIDLLYKRVDKVITICEMKFYNKPISTGIIPEVKRKCSLIEIPPGYAIETALISLYGPDKSLKNAEYFNHFITLNDIFRETK